MQAAPTLWVREEVGNQSMSSPRNSERQTIHHQTGRAKLHAGERKYCDTHLGVARKLLVNIWKIAMRRGKNRLDTHALSIFVFKPVFRTEIRTVISSIENFYELQAIPPNSI